MKIAVIGSGAWGSALATLAFQKSSSTAIISSNSERAENLKKTREIFGHPNHRLPAGIEIVSDVSSISFNPDVFLLAIPVQRTYKFLQEFQKNYKDKNLVLCNKGLDLSSAETPYQMAQKYWSEENLAVLSGPNFASEVLALLPAASVIASKNNGLATNLAASLASNTFRPYASEDPLGVSLCAAVKSCLAIAAGLCLGAKLGENARAALVTRAMKEIRHWLRTQDTKLETLYGLAGLGDILLSCSSSQSRNFEFGRALGAGENLPSNLVEGVFTLKAICSHLHEANSPLLVTLNGVLNRTISVEKAVDQLFSRKLTSES